MRSLEVPLRSARALGRRLCAWPRSVSLALCVAWYALIWLSSSRPGSSEPASLPWQILSNSAHAPLFGLWAAWLSLLAPRRAGWPYLRGVARSAVLFAVAVGGLLDELHQHLGARGRDFSVLDIATDLVGAWLALQLVALAGDEHARGRHWLAALVCAALGSFAAGACATLVPRCFPGVGWL